MKDKINIAELLKDCPQGMELYSPLCGKCVFDRLNMGTIICKKQNTQEIAFTSEGYYMLPVFNDCECLLFPSKDQRDWSKFQRPFKDGDILTTNWGSVFFLNTRLNSGENYGCYAGISGFGFFHVCKPFADKKCCDLATEEEKQKLFKAIKDNGYKWNAETKTLEKLIEPKFKVGDRIRLKENHNYIYTITGIREEENKYECGVTFVLRFSEQDNWELIPNKFDINTLIPFESRVLVRDTYSQVWKPAIYGFKDFTMYAVVGGNSYCQCIPYEGNEHLRGTTNDCDDYYKTWE